MSFRDASLRSLVEKWLGAELAACARVTRFSHTRRKQWRYVCVQARGSSRNFDLVFFKHDDGSWCVFPPDSRRLTMDFSKIDEGLAEALAGR
ncbi:hypothetical protein J8I87_35545 [Paraburkholderia sp. LEh10]|uniref:hypothetical protein n=1 Tax=Paraburkholderia sp. LEh10 TaxID=2821353 RepID=UPI001AE348CB|nr:hypothetical protein [Paraburkholderia sp. LEh10]MBP0594888.1 hypothetical protein [Paraburkholderia sp. LEh10]